MLRAATQALRHGRIVSGGSTLTMQTARLLENGSTGSWQGKLRQIRLALALEQRLSKDDILALYLTHAPFGGNLEGLRAATRAYFGKEPRRLTPAEIALLVALPQAPEARRPDRHTQRAKAARAAVLARLTNAGLLSPEAQSAALKRPLPTAQRPFPRLAFHETSLLHSTRPEQRLTALTIDAALQTRLEALTRKELAALEPRTTIAMLVADHHTGEILARIGSAARPNETRRSAFIDMTRALRSPGSALKPLIYAMAFEDGIAHPETLITDAPTRFGSYAPENFDGLYRGEITLRRSLQLSLNIPVVALLDRLGPARFMQTLRKAGAAPKLAGGKAGLATALGGLGLTLEDITTLYAGLAQGGTARPLSTLPQDAAATRFTSRAAAWHIGDILSAVPLSRARLAHGIAYKTGTSYGYRDNWAFGYDGRHVVGVWIGRPDGTPMQASYARETAAPLMAQAFAYLAPQPTPLGPPPPEALTLRATELPPPLRRFHARQSARLSDKAPRLTFPPNGAKLAQLEGVPLVLKLQGGTPPFAVFANKKLRATKARSFDISLGELGKGFYQLRIIDAAGHTAKAAIEIR